MSGHLRRYFVKVNYQKEKLILFIVTSGLLLGCSHNSPAPVFDISSEINQSPARQSTKSQSRIEITPSQYTVMPGDTLFSIAWYHSVDPRDLAEINHLKNNLI